MSRFDDREANVPVIRVALVAGLFALMHSSAAFAQATTSPATIGGQRPVAAQPASPTAAPDLTELFTAPPTKVYKLSEGRSMTAAQIRAALDALIAGKLKGPFLSARQALSGKVVDKSQLARETAEIIAETKSAAQQSTKAANIAPPVRAPAGMAPTNNAPPSNAPPGAPGAQRTIEQEAQTKIVPSQVSCADRTPYVGSFKGTITPGGTIGITGICFGTAQGQIRITGTNSNFFINLQIVAWTDTALAVTIPADISGQIDQPVEVEIVRADGKKSPDLNKVFIAAKEPEIEVHADLITSVQCGNPAGCGNRQAVHQNGIQDNPPPLSGIDIWKVQLSKGWQLTTLSTYNEYGQSISETGFEVGPPEGATFQYNWKSDTVLVGYNTLGVQYNKSYQLAKYSITVKAIGPRGVSMYPPK